MTRDQGEVHLEGLEAGSMAHVRLPNTTRTAIAVVLGVRDLSEDEVAIYLDRLVHAGSHSRVGEYLLSGGYTTILTGPRPAFRP